MEKKVFSNQKISDICMELAMLLRSGVDIGDGLTMMGEDGDASIGQMAQKADEGATLAEVFRSTEGFPEDVCGMVEAGERTGRVEEALGALSRYYEDRSRMDRQLRSALLYPSILMLIMLVVIVVLLARVLPVFNEVYANLGGQMTGIAGGLLSAGQVLDRLMPLLCVLLLAVLVLLGAFSALPSFREWVLSAWRKHFGNSGVSKQLNDAKFAQALAMGIESGLPDEEAVILASKRLSDVPDIAKRSEVCIETLQDEGSLPKALEKSGLLPKAECRLLELGRRSGAGDTTIAHIASRLSEESEMSLQERISRIEPALVVVSSILVGMILLSVMLPLMDIMATIG